eukprot:gene19711-21657_t
MAFLFLEKEKTKRKQKKQGSLEEALADLDDIPSLGISRKSKKIKVYQQNKDCLTGKYEVESTKTYPKKKKVVKALKSNAGPAVASSSSTYDLPDYQVEPNSIDDDFMESEREYSPEFLTMLDEIEKDIPFKMEKTAWERRKVNLEGNWANARNDLFHALLLRNSIPEKHAVCCKCNLNEAVIKCQECRKFLCSECDGILHNKCPFHNRNVWINGFYEGIRNNETVFDSNIITIGNTILHIPLSQGCVINATSFGKSFREWIACKYRLDAQIEESSFVCPVCDRNCHSIHVDGHRKTYRFKKVPR